MRGLLLLLGGEAVGVRSNGMVHWLLPISFWEEPPGDFISENKELRLGSSELGVDVLDFAMKGMNGLPLI